VNVPPHAADITPSALKRSFSGQNIDSCVDATGAQKGGAPSRRSNVRQGHDRDDERLRAVVSSDDAARVYDSVAAARIVGSTALATAVSDKMPFDGAMWTSF
jgi:hypothetical protein